jgi:Ran GTPase-activating protein (RanGAP) involved in mRNA processing and transport
MKIVVKHAMIKNRCKRIRLRDNNITFQGASTLADGLYNNMTLESLDLRNNSIGDLGVQYLSLAIIHSNLKTLNLESNHITAEGTQYLAQMLKNNRTLTELYLSKNHLGDRGIELLTNALNDEKKNHLDQENRVNPSTLQHLYLGQNDITDVGIEYIADMLKTNRMLTWLWLSGNEIGNRGVELLSTTLANHNLSLEWLFLNSNKSINDSSIDALINMLKRNHSLKTIYINNCNLSDIAKQKLQEITKLKKDFDLEV